MKKNMKYFLNGNEITPPHVEKKICAELPKETKQIESQSAEMQTLLLKKIINKN